MFEKQKFAGPAWAWLSLIYLGSSLARRKNSPAPSRLDRLRLKNANVGTGQVLKVL
jgi:hypothetical protein